MNRLQELEPKDRVSADRKEKMRASACGKGDPNI